VSVPHALPEISRRKDACTTTRLQISWLLQGEVDRFSQ
jgi:hypothetical protein